MVNRSVYVDSPDSLNLTHAAEVRQALQSAQLITSLYPTINFTKFSFVEGGRILSRWQQRILAGV